MFSAEEEEEEEKREESQSNPISFLLSLSRNTSNIRTEKKMYC